MSAALTSQTSTTLRRRTDRPFDKTSKSCQAQHWRPPHQMWGICTYQACTGTARLLPELPSSQYASAKEHPGKYQVGSRRAPARCALPNKAQAPACWGLWQARWPGSLASGRHTTQRAWGGAQVPPSRAGAGGKHPTWEVWPPGCGRRAPAFGACWSPQAPLAPACTALEPAAKSGAVTVT